MNVFVLSQLHPERRYVYLSANHSLEEVLNGIQNVTILHPLEGNPVPMLNRFDSCTGASNLFTRCLHRSFKSWFSLTDLPTLGKGPNVLLVIGLSAPFLLSIHALGSLLPKFDLRLGYLLDGIHPHHLHKSVTPLLDHLFVMDAELADEMNTKPKGLNTSFLPLAINTLQPDTSPSIRWIDLLSYGRSNLEFHRQLSHHFNQPKSTRIYHHSTFDQPTVSNRDEHLALMSKLLNSSKISVCFEGSDLARFNGHSPILYRWFEAWVAGCTVLGKKPFGKGVAELMDWENSSIDIPDCPSDWIPFVESVLEDSEALLKNAQRNQWECQMRHDWRYRLRDMFTTVGLPISDDLKAQIAYLQQKAQPPMANMIPV